jgi:hypothetical protein
MLYDPEDMHLAMDDDGILYRPASMRNDENGNPYPVWVMVKNDVIPQERPDQGFRRPEW